MDRKALIERRLQVANRAEKEKAIVERLLPFLKGKQTAGYMPIRGEANVFGPWIDFVPKVVSATKMVFLPPVHFKKGAFGVLEPESEAVVLSAQIDVIVVPMVAFDGKYRIGYEKGYYDRYLKTFEGLKIGVAFDDQEVYDYQPNLYDVPMDVIVTESRTIE
ncbi:5-formyltetrahydrofolate cyclo-ligase [uncultured Dubosiella sp.]|uniref:5-formyltetrahydrofolate cyclo-ligase n=1 Tax=uncultured Dubosiella sp. TaxID=1937011 RepID=UPI0025956C80|nr:5-formyltetrahydrofolate cyclo-ligase [uncultured Dubosiella sp.]